ncbi:heat shock protein 75 kDa, mitochondrial isoform X2 [Anopheles cruzii]|uniref:heat shock protein 75 kDa, mitochondrial isoform X2 n=1 Tax=Anopheles cruzii TaxID=68878 RepID=UPI0022EC7F26|nr:heat shock protein 75 kDa, mitochondrial isoform X2 [Anopheles cruzii]
MSATVGLLRLQRLIRGSCALARCLQPNGSHLLPPSATLLRVPNTFSDRLLTTKVAEDASSGPSGYHSIIRDQEKAVGDTDRHEFQAETRMLLDIVARSLYSDKEVFVRELVSNASDALEKFRFLSQTSASADEFVEADRALEIHIGTNKQERQLTIQDTGIGMTRDELIAHLGTIARSGSKHFIEQLKESGQGSQENVQNIIGQFGVGFYSAFMVADRVDVYTRSAKAGAGPGLKWSSDGSGTFEVQEAENVAIGTKIVIHLKADCREFADEDRIREVIRKYSNFVGSPIYLNGKQANQIQPIWLMEPKQVTPEQHNEFYRFVGNTFDTPRFVLHYKTDVPLSIRALLYFPEGKPGLFEMSRDADVGVALYTRKVLIQSKTENLLPKWLRFVKGVVDSEDIPLNLSRELLQNSALIRKLRTALTNRVLRFLHDRSVKEPESYTKFYKDYGLFLKEGIVTSQEQQEKEEIAKLLRFETSKEPDNSVSLPEYCQRQAEGQKDIYYLAAPNRTLAEASPYYESLKKRGLEVLFCYEAYDELVLMQLGMYLGKNLVSVEKEMRRSDGASAQQDEQAAAIEGSLLKAQIDELLPWLKQRLAGKVSTVKTTTKLDSHPCVVTVEEMAAARHFIKTQSHNISEENRYALLQPQFEINAKHPIIRKLHKLTSSDPALAELLAKQLFSNAMVGAGLVDDPRMLLTSMNDLLEKVLDKH